jgi:hypothetical protein
MVLATPVRVFVPDASPGLASSDQCLVFIGIDNVFFGSTLLQFLQSRHRQILLCILGSGETGVRLVPDVCLVLVQLWPHLVLDGFYKTVFGIDTLLVDCFDHVPVFITSAS